MTQQSSLEKLHDLGAQFIFLLKDTKRPVHKWRDPELQYIPTLTDIQNFEDGSPVTLPTKDGERVYQADQLRLAFVPGSIGLLAIDVDIPRYVNTIISSVAPQHLLEKVTTGSGGYHLFYNLPEDMTDVYSQAYFTPEAMEPPAPEEGGLPADATPQQRLLRHVLP